MHIRTVAYAPSIGIGNALLMRKEQIALMQNIDYISCREEQGAQIIGDITGREVPVVLDPTLMVRPPIGKNWLILFLSLKMNPIFCVIF